MFVRNALFFICCLSSTHSILTLEPKEIAYVTELNDAQFESFIQSAKKPVIVEFWAPWCSYCIKMKPIFEQVVHACRDDYLFVTVNLDEGQQIADKYGVTGIPLFKVIKNNVVVGTITGSTSQESLIKQIENAVQGKITQETLLSAIQTGDKELVSRCLADGGIDVNRVTQTYDIDTTIPMTPLVMATAQFLYGDSSLDIVALLLSAGAQIDLEIDLQDPQADSGFVKGSARSMAKKMAELNIEETVSKILTEYPTEGGYMINEEALRQSLLQSKAKASSLLEFFQTTSGRLV